ncbi:MAG: carboxypeptidase-like regulatory domain-containing protein [Bacteroidota bacterium]
MRKLVYLLFIAVHFSACQKKVQSEGTVYSKHNYPVANVTVVLAEYTSGKDASLTSRSTQTDNNGRFTFNYLTAKNRSFSLDVLCDSGWARKESLNRDELKHIDLRVH